MSLHHRSNKFKVKHIIAFVCVCVLVYLFTQFVDLIDAGEGESVVIPKGDSEGEEDTNSYFESSLRWPDLEFGHKYRLSVHSRACPVVFVVLPPPRARK